MELTQASTALSIVAPGGPAVGAAGAYGMLRRWAFPARDITRAVTLTGLWNQFLNLSFPIIAVFLLAITGAQTAALATVAFIGVAVLGVVLAAFVVVLVSNRLANDLGDLVAAARELGARQGRRGPVKWGGASFERFRRDAGEFLARRWHLLTLAALAGSLTVFLLLVVSLRAFDVPAVGGLARRGVRRVVARAHPRLDPDHAGRHRGDRARADRRARRLRRKQRGRRRGGARLPLPDDRPDARPRPDRGVHLAAPSPSRDLAA